MSKSKRDKPKLLIMASWGSRSDPGSPLLRFVRDYAGTLKRFHIYATGGTGRSILATGFYTRQDVTRCRSGPEGGVVELAAIVARKDCKALIFLSDPKDIRSGVPENRAIERVCKTLGVRLITTLAGAEQWAYYEANHVADEFQDRGAGGGRDVYPKNYKDGIPNVADGRPQFLRIKDQTLALISHDKKKNDMVKFVDEHVDFLSSFHRILTTGTTGSLLQLLFADKKQKVKLTKEIKARLGEDRFKDLQETMPEARRLRRKPKDSKRKFVKKVMPFPSGPDGGDILIAYEVLHHCCHTVVFFQDPLTAHPHEPDIRLFERTCQFWSVNPSVGPVYASCVSDIKSAEGWARNLSARITPYLPPVRHEAHRLRDKYKLRDVIIVDMDSETASNDLGRAIARAGAGYFRRLLDLKIGEERRTRIGIGHGWTVQQVLQQLKDMEQTSLLEQLPAFSEEVIWSPLIGNIMVEWSDREASMIASQFCDHYGGKVEAFQSSGIVKGRITGSTLPPTDVELRSNLREADIILASTAPWNKNVTLYKHTAIKPEYFPLFLQNIAGTLSAIFLRTDGKEERWDYSVVGLDYDGFHEAAKNGGVIVMCGSENRHSVVLAALEKNLISVLVTTLQTAKWILKYGAASGS